MKNIDLITGDVLDLSIRVHRALGPGLLETVYETVLAGALAGMGYRIVRQKPVDIEFEGMRYDAAFRIDILVGRSAACYACKAVADLFAAHKAARRAASQFWRRNAEGRIPALGQ